MKTTCACSMQIPVIITLILFLFLSEAQSSSVTSSHYGPEFSSLASTSTAQLSPTSTCHESLLPPAEVADLVTSTDVNGTADALFTLPPTFTSLPVANISNNSTLFNNVTATITSTLFNTSTLTSTLNATLFNASSVFILPAPTNISRTVAASLTGTSRFTYFSNSTTFISKSPSALPNGTPIDPLLPELTAAPLSVSYVTVTETIIALLPCSDWITAGIPSSIGGYMLLPKASIPTKRTSGLWDPPREPTATAAGLPSTISSEAPHALGERFTTTMPTEVPTSGVPRSNVLVAPGLVPGESMVCSVVTTVIRL